MNEREPERTFWQRHWKIIVPIVCVGPVLIMLLTCASFWWSVNKLRTSRPAYELTVQAVMGDAQVREALGEPMVLDEMILGDVRIAGDSGTASLQFGVAGPKGQALIESSATMTAGYWALDRTTVTIYTDGEPGDTIVVVESPPPLAPGSAGGASADNRESPAEPGANGSNRFDHQPD